jgi:DNA polymerase-3 subunit delta'
MGFEDIVGHASQKMILSSMLARRRIPHALLFVGQDGIGKKKVAIEFARHALCEGRTACGSCASCRMVEKAVHPDLIIMGGREESIGIESSRVLRGEVHLPPFRSKNRFILIDHAETITDEASNALLKTLEEPPAYMVFLLISAEERRIPPTVRSRCVRIAFSPLGKEEIRRFFEDVYGLNEEEARTLSLISLGSIGLGLFWLKGENLRLRKELSLVLTGSAGSVEITALSERISEDRRKTSIFLNFLLSFFRDLYAMNQGAHASLLINRDLLPPPKRLDDGAILSAMELTWEALGRLSMNVNRWLLVEHLLYRLRRLF